MGRPGVTLIPAPFRAWAWGVLALSVGVVTVLGVRYSGRSSAGRLDNALDTRLAFRLRNHIGLLDRLVSLGNPASVVAVALVMAMTLALLRPGRAVALALVGPSVAAIATEIVLKPLIGRIKGTGLAFPSGHTTGAFSLALVAGLVLLDVGRPRLPLVVRALLALGGLVLAGGTATALVALRYHYATDTVGGVGVALAAVLGTALALDLLAERFYGSKNVAKLTNSAGMDRPNA